MNVLLFLMLGVRLITPTLDNGQTTVITVGDSNTAYYQDTAQDWFSQMRLLFSDWRIWAEGRAYAGAQIQSMIADYIETISSKMGTGTNVAMLLIGINDINVAGKTEAEAYALLVELCDSLTGRGFDYLVVGTYPNSLCAAFNDSIIANYAAEGWTLADPASDANIGEAADHGSATYFDDTIHMNPTGLAILADSMAAGLNRAIERR